VFHCVHSDTLYVKTRKKKRGKKNKTAIVKNPRVKKNVKKKKKENCYRKTKPKMKKKCNRKKNEKKTAKKMKKIKKIKTWRKHCNQIKIVQGKDCSNP